MSARKILVVEDSETKFKSIERALRETVACDITRGATVVQAEQLVLKSTWWLVILDMSMNITESTLGPSSGGHATLGGIGVFEKMYLLGKEAPTVVVTAFDAFQAPPAAGAANAIVGLEYIDEYAREFLGGCFLGTVRYSDPGWEKTLKTIIQDQLAREDINNT